MASSCSYNNAQAPNTLLNLYRYCDTEPMTVGAEPYDTNGNALGLLTMASVSPGLLSTVTLAGSYSAPGNFSAQLTNLDPTMESYADVTRYPLGPGLAEYSTFGGGTPSTTTQTISMGVGLTPTAVIDTLIEAPIVASQRRTQHLYQGINGSTLTYNFDVGGNLLPWLDLPTIDLATGMVMTTVPAGTPMDAGTVAFELTKPATGSGSSATPVTYVSWLVVTPDLSTPIHLPTLPMEVGVIDPSAMDTAAIFNETIYESPSMTYDDLRNDIVDLTAIKPYTLSTNDQLLRVDSVFRFFID
jgi:hypothetical protein